MLLNQALGITSDAARAAPGAASGDVAAASHPNPAPARKPFQIKHLASHGHATLG